MWLMLLTGVTESCVSIWLRQVKMRAAILLACCLVLLAVLCEEATAKSAGHKQKSHHDKGKKEHPKEKEGGGEEEEEGGEEAEEMGDESDSDSDKDFILPCLCL